MDINMIMNMIDIDIVHRQPKEQSPTPRNSPLMNPKTAIVR